MATAVQDISSSTSQSRVRPRWHVLIAATVALLALLISLAHSFNPGEFAVDTDESFHATTGVFFADFYTDRPLAHPIEYTYRYYAKYPALGLLHWPPLFHMVEGGLFHVFGVSAQTGRLTVRLFVLLGLFYFFHLIEMLQNRRAAILATVLLALMPGLIPLENAVMIDWPALALCIAASFYWLRWLREKCAKDLWLFAAFAVLALLMKQQSGYLAVFCMMSLFAMREWRSRSFWIVAGFMVLASAPFYAFSNVRHGSSIIAHLIGSHAPGFKLLGYYIANVPALVGWWVLPFVAIGIFVSLRQDRKTAIFMLLWIVACFLSFSFLNAHEPRYNIYCIPALVYFATMPFSADFKLRWQSVAATVIGVALIFGYSAQTLAAPAPFADGVASAAQRVLDVNIPGRPVLFDGNMSGDFIFYMRALDPSRGSIVLRKSLYATNILQAFGSEQLVEDPGQIGRVLDDYGVHIVVVTQNERMLFPVQRVLRQYLQTPRFRRIARIHIDSNEFRLQGTILEIYENLQTKEPSAQSLDLRMLTLDHDIVVPMSGLASNP